MQTLAVMIVMMTVNSNGDDDLMFEEIFSPDVGQKITSFARLVAR